MAGRRGSSARRCGVNILGKIFHRESEREAIRTAARTMGRAGVTRQRAKVRATTDAMRERLGMPPADWPENLS